MTIFAKLNKNKQIVDSTIIKLPVIEKNSSGERRKSSLRTQQSYIGLGMIVLGVVCTVLENILAPGPDGLDLTMAVVACGIGVFLLISRKTLIR